MDVLLSVAATYYSVTYYLSHHVCLFMKWQVTSKTT